MACRLVGAKPISEPMRDIIYWAPRNKHQCNFNQNSSISIQENQVENLVWEMASVLSRPSCVKVNYLTLMLEDVKIVADAAVIMKNNVSQFVSRCLVAVKIVWKHDDVIKWKHFPRYWPFVRGIHRSRWIPRTKASDAELWCFLWSAPEYTIE